MEISERIADGGLAPPDAILAFVENTGRFDHIMANIQTLFLGTEVFLSSTGSHSRLESSRIMLYKSVLKYYGT